MFERLRAALDAALAAATPPPDLRDLAARMGDGLVEARSSVSEMREAASRTERELALERRDLQTALRRRELAAGIGDSETASVAERFAAKHRSRSEVLEKKLAAQREEIALAEREIEEMTARLAEVTKGRAGLEAERSRDAAWAGLGRAGMDRPELDLEQEALKVQMERAAREAEAERKLEEIKKKMGRT